MLIAARSEYYLDAVLAQLYCVPHQSLVIELCRCGKVSHTGMVSND